MLCLIACLVDKQYKDVEKLFLVAMIQKYKSSAKH